MTSIRGPGEECFSSLRYGSTTSLAASLLLTDAAFKPHSLTLCQLSGRHPTVRARRRRATETNPSKGTINWRFEGFIERFLRISARPHSRRAERESAEHFDRGRGLLGRAGKKNSSKYEGSTFESPVSRTTTATSSREHGFQGGRLQLIQGHSPPNMQQCPETRLQMSAYQVSRQGPVPQS